MSSESWVFQNSDDMEFGDTGYVSRSDGWMENKHNGFTRDPEGRIYDSEGELVFDPQDDDDYNFEDEEEDYRNW